MPRILGIDIPKEKRIEISLTYIFGIGRTRSNEILKEAGVSPDKRAQDLDEKEVTAITQTIQNFYQVKAISRLTRCLLLLITGFSIFFLIPQ